jgi:hypothetical protein
MTRKNENAESFPIKRRAEVLAWYLHHSETSWHEIGVALTSEKSQISASRQGKFP